MRITPLDVENVAFSRSFRGYEPREVDEFLDLVSETLKELMAKNEELERELIKSKEELDRYRSIEQTIKDALVLAQRTAEEIIASAKERAKSMLEEAEAKAKGVLEEARRRALEMEYDLEEVRSARKKMLLELKAMISTFSEMIESQLEDGRG